MSVKRNPVRIMLWLGVLVACFLPSVNFLPNRLFGSEPVYLLMDWLFTKVLLLCLILCLGALSIIHFPRLALVLITASLITLCVVVGLQANALVDGQSDTAMVSLASGFWLMLIFLALMLLDGLQRFKQFWWRAGIVLILFISLAVILYQGYWDNIAIIKEYYKQAERFNQELINHFILVGMTLVIVLCIGIPLGIVASRRASFAEVIFPVLNTTQTLPSIALFALLIAPLSALVSHFPFLKQWGISGIGMAPALIALVLYTLLPITRNTYAAFEGVPISVKKSALAMGMTRWQLWRQISLPLALPVILSGVRIVLVQAVGLTVVAALIGAGGLGIFVWQGLGENVADLVLLGAIPTILIALTFDLLMQMFITLSHRQGYPS